VTTQQPPVLTVLQPGTLFRDRYRVVRAIKAGGMGAVYEVVDARTDARCALKVMLLNLVEDAELRGRFALEARVTGDIESEHIVRVSDAGVDEASGTPFLVMELLRGEDLGATLKRRGPLPADEVTSYLGQAALALDKTHAASIVHRDLKPDNLFITQRDDGSPCIKLLDFGIAKVVAQHQRTQGTQALGTPVYMAPEQIKGKGGLGPGTDVYALGHIAYTLLAGEPYWEEERQSTDSLFPVFSAIVAGPIEPPVARAERRKGVTLPSGFDAWFAKATAARVEDRFDRASAAVAALGPALATPTAALIRATAAMRARAMGEGGPPPGRGKLVGLGAAVLLAVGLAVAAVARSPGPTLPAAHKRVVTGRIARQVDEASKLLDDGKDVDGAHKKLLEIGEDDRPIDDPRFQKVEAAWADVRFTQVEKEADAAMKKAILKEIVGNSLDPSQKGRAAKMMTEIEAKEPPPPPPTDVRPMGTFVPGGSRLDDPYGDTPAGSSTAVPNRPSSNPPDEEKTRRALEPKVWSGQASLDEIRMLKAICSHMGDHACRNRANEMLQKKQAEQ
jgi:serine/threonine protein kinase